jgi:hypothetical protein
MVWREASTTAQNVLDILFTLLTQRRVHLAVTLKFIFDVAWEVYLGEDSLIEDLALLLDFEFDFLSNMF